jgi:hypothetical protein
MMGLTKRDKDFWLKELKHELQQRVAVFQPAIDRCLELAKVKAVKEVKIGKDWASVQRRYQEVLEAYIKYTELKDDMDDLVEALNDKLLPYRHDIVQYGRTYTEKIKVEWSHPGYHGVSHAKLKDDWLKYLVETHFLEAVMIAEGVTEPLEIAEVEKKLERNIMLATSASQLKEFLEAFMSENDIEV